MADEAKAAEEPTETTEEELLDVLGEMTGEEDEPQPEEEESDEPADPDGENEEAADEEAEEEPAEPATPMPKSWSKDDAEAWKALSPEAQAVVARREGERDSHLLSISRKAAETRHTVENEAREVIAKQAEQHAAVIQAYAQQFMPQAPDQRLLYTGNPDDVLTYHRQDAAYRAATDQQQKLHQEVERAQQQAAEARQAAEQQEIAVDRQRLQEQLPEWFDPSVGAKLRESLQSIAAELGYPAELQAQAGSTDILALKKAAEWKAKADKLDALNGKKMAAVRSAKGLPKMARPGVSKGKPSSEAKANAAWAGVKNARSKEAQANAFADFMESSGLL